MSRSETLGFMPATEMIAQIRSKALSPVEIVQGVLERIAALEPQVNAFAHLKPDHVLAAARVAETRVMQGGELPALLGVPVTIKEHLAVRDMPNASGSALRRDVDTEDNPVVTRLRDAGAIILGKTTMSEFGWKGVSESPLHGITHNPWKRGYNAGASSSGAAAAAAVGFGPLHQGSDGAGSIRMPAHFSGVYGIKPSYGRVPLTDIRTGDHIVHLGPITRTVADASVMLKIMAGPHPGDPSSLECQPADYPALLRRAPRELRIAFSPDLGHARVDREVAELVAKAVAAFETDLGLPVEEVTPKWGPRGPEIENFLWPAHQTHHIERVSASKEQMDQGLVACVEASLSITLPEYHQALAWKHAYISEIHRFFSDWDFLLTPAVSVAAFPADRLQPAHWPQHPWNWLSWAPFSYPFNLSWNPAASVPCGFTSAGLPVGLQIAGRRFDDLGVLQLSAAFETVRPWARRRPPGF
jgi:aspartyl-tRNA(Asn)/glutamyl-tRNA(Gln) amidotransferase subunit A